MSARRGGLFYARFAERVGRLGGMHNAHLHLDRVGTLDERYMGLSGHRALEASHVSLRAKHDLIGALHAGPAYDRGVLRSRVERCLDTMVAVGTTRADTVVDVTLDRVGLTAFEVLREIRDTRRAEIDLRLGAYSPFGFLDAEPERWALLERAARAADFIGSLPEADHAEVRPDHIGFREHLRRHLELAGDLGVPLQVHTDQRNEPSEDGTERLIDAVREVGAPASRDGAPTVWAVHVISPSTYDDDRFRRLVEGLLECRIGIICCPSAALGMRQLRPLATPTYNSIPRVLELLDAGVHVRLGCDNVEDMCSPTTTPDLTDEVFVLSAALRFYHVEVLARLASGGALTPEERAVVRDHLARDAEEAAATVDALGVEEGLGLR